MASARINILNNIETDHRIGGFGAQWINIATRTFLAQYVYIPGSISFNNVAMQYSCAGTTARTMSASFGLYTLNGATLSLMNSATATTQGTDGKQHWLTMVTSATQDITPGEYWFGFLFASAGTATSQNLTYGNAAGIGGGKIGGPFVRGYMSVSTTQFPVSVATSDMSQVGGDTAAGRNSYPLVIISA